VVCHIKVHRDTSNIRSAVQPMMAYDIVHLPTEHEP